MTVATIEARMAHVRAITPTLAPVLVPAIDKAIRYRLYFDPYGSTVG